MALPGENRLFFTRVCIFAVSHHAYIPTGPCRYDAHIVEEKKHRDAASNYGL